jgi:hypothetical protein
MYFLFPFLGSYLELVLHEQKEKLNLGKARGEDPQDTGEGPRAAFVQQTCRRGRKCHPFSGCCRYSCADAVERDVAGKGVGVIPYKTEQTGKGGAPRKNHA